MILQSVKLIRYFFLNSENLTKNLNTILIFTNIQDKHYNKLNVMI